MDVSFYESVDNLNAVYELQWQDGASDYQWLIINRCLSFN